MNDEEKQDILRRHSIRTFNKAMDGGFTYNCDYWAADGVSLTDCCEAIAELEKRTKRKKK